MKPLILFLCFIFFFSEGNASVSDQMPDTSGRRILIINAFDASEMKARKNKKELFAELADSLKQLLYERIDSPYKEQVTIYPDLLKETANSDSSIFYLMDNYNAFVAIIIKDIDVHFNQTGMEVTGEKNHKTRTAYYDLCAIVTYALYNSETKLNEQEINICEHYTHRDVISGLLTVGPDIVGKKK